MNHSSQHFLLLKSILAPPSWLSTPSYQPALTFLSPPLHFFLQMSLFKPICHSLHIFLSVYGLKSDRSENADVSVVCDQPPTVPWPANTHLAEICSNRGLDGNLGGPDQTKRSFRRFTQSVERRSSALFAQLLSFYVCVCVYGCLGH